MLGRALLGAANAEDIYDCPPLPFQQVAFTEVCARARCAPMLNLPDFGMIVRGAAIRAG